MSADAKDIQLMELKDTILQLNETIRIQNAAMDDLRKMIAGLQQTLNNKQAEIDYLKSKMFGSSSEKGKVLIPGQMNLLTEDLEDDRTPVEIEPEIIKVAEHKRERKAKATYEVMFANLPVRQEKDFENLFGIKINRGTMAHWTIYVSEKYFSPLYNYFHRLLLSRRFLCADETPIQVLKEEGRKAQTKSYIWLFRTGEDGGNSIILYHYAATRSGDTAVEFLKGVEKGFYLVADGYGGYNKLKDIRRCCCYAHIRRYLYEAIPKGKENDYTEPAVQGYLYINKLFDYERQYRQKCLSKKQLENRRLKDQKPVIEAFLKWLDRQSTVKGSRLDRAVTYCQNQRPYMMTYLEDARCSLSNNISENSIRPVTCGRKNWLFSDTTAGANASMIVYSLIEMAKANGINPLKYLEYILDARPNKEMLDEELEKLSPWNDEVKRACQNNSEQNA